MPAKNENLHGNVPESCPAALLMIDVINDLDFEDGKKLLEHAKPMSRRLAALGTKTVIVTGLTTDICVLFTAADAHMRDLYLVVPEDCSAAASREDHERALALMREKLDADTAPSEQVDLEALKAGSLRKAS